MAWPSMVRAERRLTPGADGWLLAASGPTTFSSGGQFGRGFIETATPHRGGSFAPEIRDTLNR